MTVSMRVANASCREILVQWTTLNRTEAGVQWGSSPGKYTASAVSDTQTYTRAEMCGPPANTSGWGDPGLLHFALMSGLQPSTRYYYIVGDKVNVRFLH